MLIMAITAIRFLSFFIGFSILACVLQSQSFC